MQALTAIAARRQQRGLTLIEACVALAVVAVLAGTAAPAIDGVLKSKRLEGQAGELAIDLRYVRSEAVARNEGVRIRFQSLEGGTCTVIHTGASTDCSCTSSGIAQCSNGATALKTTFYPAGGVAIQANVASMRFDPGNGTVTPAATIRVIGADGRAIHHVVNMVGRVRSCASGKAVHGVRAC
jgi:type IV fimbrial biogenesis protein FimT